MQLTHSFSVPATIDVAWATFMDLREVGECFPGATVTEASGDSFTGQVKVKLGPIAMVYTGVGTFTERDDESHHAVIKAEGKDKRGNGTAGATATIQLSPDGVDHTQVDVTTDLLVTGKPAQFGRGVMQDVSDKLLAQFVSCIEGKLSSGSAPSGSRPAASSGADVESEASKQTAAQGASSGAAASSKPLGTAAMFGATAGADSWEKLSGRDSGSGASSASGTSASASGSASGSASSTTSGSGSGGAATGSGSSSRPAASSPTSAARPAPAAAYGAAGGSDDALDLGAMVLPVLLKTHGREVAIGAVAFIVGWKLARFLPG